MRFSVQIEECMLKASMYRFFSVYKDKIICNTGTYDFELNRCATLNNAVEQTALARAIAVEMQAKTIEYYPTDPSGTSPKVELSQRYLMTILVRLLRMQRQTVIIQPKEFGKY